MKPVATHYGWPVSPYSAKTRSYLRYKGIAFADRTPSLWTLQRKIKRAVGKIIMPTVQLSNGEWLQDSSSIIDEFERRFPEPGISPSGACQRVASALLEVYADEWLPMSALHYRWNLPQNADFAMREFVRLGVPGLPFFIGKRAVIKVAKRLQGYLPLLGVDEVTSRGVESATECLIGDLEKHLVRHSYLLGGRPCLGDFALFGPLYAHLYRDPASRFLFDEAPSVLRWMERIRSGAPAEADFLSNDEVPETLSPVFARIAKEQSPVLVELADALLHWRSENPGEIRPPKVLGKCAFQIGGQDGERLLISAVLWKAQRVWDRYRDTTESERSRVDEWLRSVELYEGVSHPNKCRLERRSFRMFLA